MKYSLRYSGHSGLRAASWGVALSLAPNLARNRVSFDGELTDPLRFREAVSALHDVVVGDLRHKPKDRSAWLAWKAEEARVEAEVRAAATTTAAASAKGSPPANLESDFKRLHRIYWDARRKWANELSRHDPEMFRHLVPCDPVVTVAPDVLLFEGFSKDEASYGCLTVSRESFRGAQDATLGTTNVDYSLGLYDHFQSLRTYRQTRFLVDPSGFEVKTSSQADHREEKIDLPATWLRGFGQLQGAMTLPARVVTLPVGAVYSLLAHLARHKEKTGPRALRFELAPGQVPNLVLEPWNQRIDATGGRYGGEKAETIKVWGRRRLFALGRLLPLAERVEVRLLGTGLPSIWTVYMGDLRFTLALSGWTANEWSGGASLQLLAGDTSADLAIAQKLEAYLADVRTASIDTLAKAAQCTPGAASAALYELTKRGQVMFDFAAHAYRYRPVMPVALSESVLGPEPAEVVEGLKLARTGQVTRVREDQISHARRLLVVKAGETTCEAVVDLDGAIGKAKCSCSHFFRFGLRAGPCRHLLALRFFARGEAQGTVRWMN